MGSADFSGLVIVMMDDYLVRAGDGFRRVDATAHYSCERFALEEIARPLSTAVSPGHRIRPDHVWLPDPANAEEYDKRIEEAGGVDLFLVASGASDGHVAFNRPGTPPDSRTSLIELAETTRRDNLGTCPQFRSIDEVPTHGVSVGLGTIAGWSRSVRLVIHGADKRQAASRVLQATDFDPTWPATFIHRCRDAQIWLDRVALDDTPVKLPRVRGHPHA